MSAKPLLVGELNPYGADPVFALYPAPDGSAGHRLATKVMGLERADYLRRFVRANLCTGAWSARAAALEAVRLTGSGHDRVVLLGRRVCSAFGIPFEPFDRIHAGSLWIVVLPHPSGRNRLWNEPRSYERARAVLREAGIL